ncbi:MAG: hypothetical protein RLY32_565 [Pseudomonadota bacterium]
MQIESLSTELVEKAFQFIANPHGQFPPAELQHLQPGHWQALGHLLATLDTLQPESRSLVLVDLTCKRQFPGQILTSGIQISLMPVMGEE